MENRKDQHIKLSHIGQITANFDSRFNYEPMINAFKEVDLSREFLSKKISAPIFLSSITGGGSNTVKINNALAIAARELNLPLAFGSLRSLLTSLDSFNDFDLRNVAGSDAVLLGNIGISQLEKLLKNNELDKLSNLLTKLKYDALVIHVNPMQEFLQPEGDRFGESPIDTIKSTVKDLGFKVFVKEVGSGMGPKSLKALLGLDITGIELAGLGGTNFSKIESLRSNVSDELSYVGHSASEMLNTIKDVTTDKIIIASGGVKNYLDGYYYLKKYPIVTCYGQAYQILRHAGNAGTLLTYLKNEIAGLKFAHQFLEVK